MTFEEELWKRTLIMRPDSSLLLFCIEDEIIIRLCIRIYMYFYKTQESELKTFFPSRVFPRTDIIEFSMIDYRISILSLRALLYHARIFSRNQQPRKRKNSVICVFCLINNIKYAMKYVHNCMIKKIHVPC